MNLTQCKTIVEVNMLANERIRQIITECTHENYEYEHDNIQGGSYTCKTCNKSVSRLPF